MDTPQSSTVIDWAAPWLQHLGADVRDELVAASALVGSGLLIPALNDLAARVAHPPHAVSGHAVRFVPQTDLPDGVAYETHIWATGHVPTRSNHHDFFNACVWLSLPRIKAALNARQAQTIVQSGIGNRRGGVRDAMTLFDENAAILVSSDATIIDALHTFRWQDALVTPRAHWWSGLSTPNTAYRTKLGTELSRARVYLFGHALMEKLLAPRKSMCAHTWTVQVDAAWFAGDTAHQLRELDALVSEQVTHIHSSRDYAPLPILGVPHFCQDNADAAFYNDAHVFRAGRRATVAAQPPPALHR